MILRITSLMVVLSLLSSSIISCESEDAGMSASEEPPTGWIEVTPGGAVTLGYFEKQTFVVALKDENGDPLVGEPIEARIIGTAHNSDMSPLDLTSDKNGEGEVTFSAPDQEAELSVRFSSPALENNVQIPVEIDPDVFGLSVLLAYEGIRNFDHVRVSLFKDTDCAASAVDQEMEAQVVQTGTALPFYEFDCHRKGFCLANPGINNGAVTCFTLLKQVSPSGR